MEEVKIIRWAGEQRPDERAIKEMLGKEGLSAYEWSNGPGDVYAAHSHAYHKVIYVVRGSIAFGLPDQNREIDLQAGDRLELPSEVRHNAVVGPNGVVCLEAHRT